MFKIIDRYIFKQVLLATIISMLLFIIVWISPEILFRIIRQTVYGEISTVTAFKLFFLEMPEILGKGIPVGLLLGSLFVFDRLSKDSEVVIFRGIGVSLKRMLAPVLTLSVIMAGFCFYTYDNLIPYSTTKIKQLKDFRADEQFIYVDKDKNDNPKQILIVAYFDGKNAYNAKVLTLASKVNDQVPLMTSIMSGDRAFYKGDHWVITNGQEYKIAPNGVYSGVSKFTEKRILEGESAKSAMNLLIYSTKRDREMSIASIQTNLKLLKKENFLDEYRYLLNKFYQRYAQAFSCVLLGICGVILGINKPRDKRYFGYIIATGIIFLYYIIVPFLDMLAQNDILPPFLAASLPCILISIALYYIAKSKQL